MASKDHSPSRSPTKSKNSTKDTSPQRNGGDLTQTEDFVKCELCRHTIEDPKTLECLHSYCRNCLVAYVSETSNKNVTSQRMVTCPMCLQATPVTNPGNSCEDWIDALPTNEFLHGYLEAVSLKNPKKVCDTCRRQNKSECAQQWCTSCHDALCDECVSFHNALKTTTQHNLVYLSKIRNQPIEKIMSAPLCKQHEGENVTKYCETHREVVCEKCVAGSHKACRDVKLLRDSVMRHRNEVSRTNETLNEGTKLSKAIYDDRTKQDDKLDDYQNSLLQKIQNVRQRINENLMQCEAQVIAQLYDVHGKEKSGIKTDMKEAQRIRKSSGKIHGLGASASKYGSDSHVLQLMPDTATQSEHYKGKLGSLNGRIKHTSIDFIVDANLGKLMTGINKLGELRVTQAKGEVPTPHLLRVKKSDSDPEDEIDARSHVTKRSNIKSDNRSFKSLRFENAPDIGASFMESFTGRTESDNEICWFTGVEYLPEGQIAVVDRNNSKIKVFNANYKLMSETSLTHQPFGLAVVSETEVAITVPRENKIEIFKLGSSLTLTDTITTSDRCYGISYSGNRFAVACTCASPPSIKVLTRDGEEKHDICPEDNYHPMFFRPWYVQMDGQGSNMYVSDCHRCHLTCITGTVMKTYMYKDNSLNSPRGLHVTKDGRVILCGFGSDNVQVINADGILVGDLVVRTDDISGPQDVTLNSAGDTMALTFDPSSGKSDIVNVYKVRI